MKPALDKFVKRLGLENEPIKETNAGFIPLHGPLKKFQKDNILLVGDAAGHTNPLTGGGVPVAIYDGILVSEIIKKHLKSGYSLNNYQKLWWKSNWGKTSKLCLKLKNKYIQLLKDDTLSNRLDEVGTQHIKIRGFCE